jgi:lipopolysaccharide transport system ATP-binding protein
MAEIAVRLENVSKVYKLYDSKRDRLKEALDPRRRKRHREFYALRDVDMEVKKGEILGIVGRNGAGKSTLLKLIAGVIPPSRGRVEVRGRVSALLDLGAGMNPNLDGVQNILFGGIMLGFTMEEMKRKLDGIVAFADIGKFIRQPLRTYSSGMRARLGFALAVNVEPEILVVDEVLAVGDELFRRKCYAKMESLMGAGCTVVFVSHAVNTVNDLCHRVVLIDGGNLLMNGPPRIVTMFYLKLLNASGTNAAQVRGEIKHLNAAAALPKAFSVSTMRAEKKCPAEADEDGPLRAAYVPGLVPKSTLVQRNHDVDISDVEIVSGAAERVNVLVMGEDYHLTFKAVFNQEACGVSFGTAVKSEKGVVLCSANLRGDFIPLIEKGQRATVHFVFTCNLLPGNYYVTLNASEDRSGKREVLIQIQDVLIFKVLADRKTGNIGGLSYCNQFLEVEIV